LAQARQKLAAAFTAAGNEPAGLEARLFVQAVTGLTPLALATCASESLLDQASAALLRDYASRRLAGEPISRILGRSGFYGLNLHVAPEVLDPRADTETLVNAALALLDARTVAQPRILDLGIGSGAILCALLDARPDALGFGVDISSAACALTRRNLAHCGLSERSVVVRGDWTDALSGRFDLIVSNPPYISHSEIAALEREVIAFDPILALDGGVDGLDPYRRIASDLLRLLRPGGAACFEIGWRQGKDVTEILRASGFGEARIFKDNGHRDRVVTIEVS
jgi:release factor glutamine methyltransferase